MAVALKPLLSACRMPLYAISPSSWDGPSFVGEVGIAQHEVSRIPHLVQFVYLDEIDGTTMGAQVSNLDAGWHAAEPVRDHVTRFVARFDPSSALPRGRLRKVLPFGSSEFSRRDLTVGMAGQTRGALVLTHRQIPLQVARVAAREGERATDLAVVTWRLDVRAVAEKVERVGVAFADLWDARAARDGSGDLEHPLEG